MSPQDATGATPLPLAGVKVMDLTWAIAGPLIGKNMALFGATVIKIESRKRPDSGRMSGPMKDGRVGLNRSGNFTHINASKLSLSLRLDLPASRPVVERLVRWADVVTENYTPGVIERQGLGYETLKALNPGVILVSTSMQGRSGPRATHPGFGSSLQALSGLDYLSGHAGSDFGAPTAVLPDFFGPWFSLASIVAALEERERTGKGTWLEISQFEATLQVLAPQLIAASRGEPQERHGNHSPEACPQGVFPTRDGRWLAVTVTGDEQWARCAAVLGLAPDARFATHEGRQAHESEIEEAIAAATRARRAVELATRLQEAGVAAYPVAATGADLLDDPQLNARGHWAVRPHPVVGPVPIGAPAFHFSAFEPSIAAGPVYGAQTRETLSDLLGFSAAEIDALAEAGAVQFQ